MAKTESTPRGLQKTLLVTLGAAYLVQVIFSVMSLFQYFPTVGNSFAFYMNIAQLVLLPLVAFFAAWWISPRKISKLGKVFESAVLAVIYQAAVMFVGTIVTVLPIGTLYTFGYTLAPLTVPPVLVVVYVIILLALRTTKRWK